MRIVSSALKIFIIADLGSPCFKIRQFGNSPNCSSFTNSEFFFHFYYAPVCLAKFIDTVRKQLTNEDIDCFVLRSVVELQDREN